MKAVLVISEKEIAPNGAIIHSTVWKLPRPTPERPHGYKYSLFYGYPGHRIVGYDNERGKGDHRHYRSREETYRFVDLPTLIRDFRDDVAEEMARG